MYLRRVPWSTFADICALQTRDYEDIFILWSTKLQLREICQHDR